MLVAPGPVAELLLRSSDSGGYLPPGLGSGSGFTRHLRLLGLVPVPGHERFGTTDCQSDA